MIKQNSFYVGYHEKMPSNTKSFIQRFIVHISILSGLICLIIMFTQSVFYPSQFEYLNYRSFTGQLVEKPYPILKIDQPNGQKSSYYLVNFGKFGASQSVTGLNGKRIKLSGALIYRDNQTMIEIESGSIKIIGGFVEQKLPIKQPSEPATFVGEIVDSKCFFGVMKPGNLKAHKSCAIRCISGGIPPVLIVKNGDNVRYLLLVSEKGEAVNKEVLDMIAVPVKITGQLIINDQISILRADPKNYVRL